jgi:hypothetical protein
MNAITTLTAARDASLRHRHCCEERFGQCCQSVCSQMLCVVSSIQTGRYHGMQPLHPCSHVESTATVEHATPCAALWLQVGPAAFILHLKPAHAAGSQPRTTASARAVSLAGEGPGLQVFPGSIPDMDCVSAGCDSSGDSRCLMMRMWHAYSSLMAPPTTKCTHVTPSCCFGMCLSRDALCSSFIRG